MRSPNDYQAARVLFNELVRVVDLIKTWPTISKFNSKHINMTKS